MADSMPLTLDLYRGDLHARARSWTTLHPDERRRRAVRAAADKDAAELWALCEAYLIQRARSGLLTSPHTFRNYRSGLGAFIRHADGHAVNLLRPQPEAAQDYVGAVLAGGHKISTVRARVASAELLYRALRWAGASDATPFVDVAVPKDFEHPLDKNPPYHERELRAVAAELQARLAAADGRRRARLLELWALLILLWHAGLRIDEALSLEWAQLQLDAEAPSLRVASGKGRKSRAVPLSDALVAALRAYRGVPRRRSHGADFVLPYRSWSGAAYHLRPLFAAAQLPGLPSPTFRGFHAIRKRMGTRLYEELEDFVAVAEILGHADVNTTRAYVRVGQRRAGRVMRGW
jgi:integrase/recombinase XerC